MIKHTHYIAAILFTSLFSCNDFESNDANLHKMEDTLFKTLPTVNRVSVEVVDHNNVVVTLGDAELFNASEADRHKVVDEIAPITAHIFAGNNKLEKGTVIFVKEENTLNVTEKKEYDMQIKNLLDAGK